MLTSQSKPEGCEVKNRFPLSESQDEDEDGPPGLTDSEDEEELKVPVRVKRWSRNASRREEKKGYNNISILQDMMGSAINGCSENAKEWEELELLVDSGASATVVGKRRRMGQWRRRSLTPVATTRWLTAASFPTWGTNRYELLPMN